MNRGNQYSKDTTTVLIICVVAVLVACVAYIFLKVLAYSAGAAFGGAGGYQPPPDKYIAVFHATPQVIYRLDDHRYVELTNYKSCDLNSLDRRLAKAYYYDTQLGIKTSISADSRYFKGRVINADPSGKNIVLAVTPSEITNGYGKQTLIYSKDYGRTFSSVTYSSSGYNSPISDSKNYTVVITDKELVTYHDQKRASGRLDVSIWTFNQLDEINEDNKRYEIRNALPDYTVVMERYQCNSAIKSEMELIPRDEYYNEYLKRHDN